MTYNSSEFMETQQIVVDYLSKNGWVVIPYGREIFPDEFQDFLNNFYDSTGLFVRTIPDLIAGKSDVGLYLIECKDSTPTGVITGNYSIEAYPWFHNRFLNRIGINIVYAINDPKYGLRFFKPNDFPFNQIQKIRVPNKHEEFWWEHEEKLKEYGFKEIRHLQLNPTDARASNDPFILLRCSDLEHATKAVDFVYFGIRKELQTIESFCRD